LSKIERPLHRVLIVPPDFTRFQSGTGKITQILYELLTKNSQIDILPALGTHSPMSEEQISQMFTNIPKKVFKTHNWRKNVIKIGEIPSNFIKKISDGKLNYSIDIEINQALIEGNYDYIFSVGQVVPHEVSGMANGNKNIIVGLGGKDIIDKSHFLGAIMGMERIMGAIKNPVRDLFEYIEMKYLSNLSLTYILTVLKKDKLGNMRLRGLFAGDSNRTFNQAAKLSQSLNLDLLKKDLKKIVVYLDPNEFKSTWLGNKSIYRTRMALANNGDLIVLAPGLKEFGEDLAVDRLIRKYGYVSTNEILEFVKNNNDLSQNLAAAAHLIHGNSEGRFKITYCPGNLTKEEIKGVNYHYADLQVMLKKFDPEKLVDGFNTLPDGEEVFYISNPAIGLWTLKEKFESRRY
jgi:nickel-dependent lactate racemase